MFNPLNTNPAKWSNTLLPTITIIHAFANELFSMFDHFVV